MSFNFQENRLFVESKALSEIAQEFGTPCYVYSRAAFESQLAQYHKGLDGQSGLICYAVKACSNIAILNILAKKGAGFDIVSIGELQRVIRAGGDPKKVVFSGVAKEYKEIQYALEVGIHCFNVESPDEIDLINQVAFDLNKIAPISLRVNPDVDAKTHPYISTGLKDNKFGVDIKQAVSVYERAAKLKNIEIKGVDCHIGSQLIDMTPFMDALDRVLNLVDELAKKNIIISHLDLGGGIGVDYQGETPPDIAAYIQDVREKIKGRDLSLIFEPGRSISANSGVLLTKVQFLKPNDHKNFAIIDAGMNDLIRPSLYSAWQKIQLIEPSSAPLKTWDLVGPICETGDFLGKDRELALEQNAVVAVMGSGAYGFSMSSNYNSRNKPCEILVDGAKVHVIGKRQTIEQQLENEQLISE
ncbi:MAG: diaminopimelate decarboxylase [Saccharospirillaceae bacterium]|nr:diaminopimelate decarboxylase [Pseudomonadales bacterium]NRB81042.1 diaminopimelate decarboxylase [Saccharospirillaceae bacterium]